jgi:flagellar L-ring protein precursor FlgH
MTMTLLTGSKARLLALAVAATLPLAACGSISEAVSTPKTSPIAYPAAIVPTQQYVMTSPDSGARPASPNSLWRNGARAFFHDQRASRVGDILTVNIAINDAAKLSNESVATRKGSNSLGVPNLLGFESTLARNLPKSFAPATAVTTSSAFTNDGVGSVNRSETVSLTVAAVVTGVLPNGNLVIQGKQEIMINAELRELTVAGIVRPEDITSTNTIQHTQIAEARVSYGGRGSVSRVQNTPAGTALMQKFSPF